MFPLLYICIIDLYSNTCHKLCIRMKSVLFDVNSVTWNPSKLDPSIHKSTNLTGKPIYIWLHKSQITSKLESLPDQWTLSTIQNLLSSFKPEFPSWWNIKSGREGVWFRGSFAVVDKMFGSHTIVLFDIGFMYNLLILQRSLSTFVSAMFSNIGERKKLSQNTKKSYLFKKTFISIHVAIPMYGLFCCIL